MPMRGCLTFASTLRGTGMRLNMRWCGEAAIPRLRGTRRTRRGLGPSLPESFFSILDLAEDSDGARRGLGEDSETTRVSVRLGKRLGSGLGKGSGGTRKGLGSPRGSAKDSMEDSAKTRRVLGSFPESFGRLLRASRPATPNPS